MVAKSGTRTTTLWQLPFWIKGESYCLLTYGDSDRKHTNFVRRVFLSLELIFVKTRGEVDNPFSLALADLINKYSGAKPLMKALNTVGVTYSNNKYRIMRTKLIEKNTNLQEKLPFPNVDLNIYHMLTIDNFDSNTPGGDHPGFHSLGPLYNQPNANVMMPASMKDVGHDQPQPSAPVQEESSDKRDRTQISIPREAEKHYLPLGQRKTVILGVGREVFELSAECKLKIDDHKNRALVLTCFKAEGGHNCKQNPSIKGSLK